MARGAPQRKALVLGEDIRSLLSVVRSLGRGGIDVHIGMHPSSSEALRSRYLTRAHHLPTYRPDDDCWKRAMVELMDRERFDLIIPCSDPTLVPLQTHRAELEPHGRIYLLDDSAFRIASDKFMANDLARSLGIRVPRELVVRRIDEADRVREMFELPVVIKPQSSHDRGAVGPRRLVRKLDSWEKLIPLLREMLAAGPVAVQEYVRGRGTGVELLLADGEPLLEFQHQRLHEPPQGGAGPYRQSMPLTPELRAAALAFLGACSTPVLLWSSSRLIRRRKTGRSSRSMAASGAHCPWRLRPAPIFLWLFSSSLSKDAGTFPGAIGWECAAAIGEAISGG